jgi:hypothetical protein
LLSLSNIFDDFHFCMLGNGSLQGLACNRQMLKKNGLGVKVKFPLNGCMDNIAKGSRLVEN